MQRALHFCASAFIWMMQSFHNTIVFLSINKWFRVSRESLRNAMHFCFDDEDKITILAMLIVDIYTTIS